MGSNEEKFLARSQRRRPGRLAEYNGKHVPGVFQIPAPTALCRAAVWGQEGWEHTPPPEQGDTWDIVWGKEVRQVWNAAEEGDHNPNKR